jgi:hypothetical protein
MDMNDYVLEIVARERLAEMRAKAEREHTVAAARSAGRPLRVVVGHALIHLGRRLQQRRRSRVVTTAAGSGVQPRRTLPQGAGRG